MNCGVRSRSALLYDELVGPQSKGKGRKQKGEREGGKEG